MIEATNEPVLNMSFVNFIKTLVFPYKPYEWLLIFNMIVNYSKIVEP